QDALTAVLRDGARRLLAQAVEAKVAAYIERPADKRDEQRHRLVVRNGHNDERRIQTWIEPVRPFVTFWSFVIPCSLGLRHGTFLPPPHAFRVKSWQLETGNFLPLGLRPLISSSDGDLQAGPEARSLKSTYPGHSRRPWRIDGPIQQRTADSCPPTA